MVISGKYYILDGIFTFSSASLTRRFVTSHIFKVKVMLLSQLQ